MPCEVLIVSSVRKDRSAILAFQFAAAHVNASLTVERAKAALGRRLPGAGSVLVATFVFGGCGLGMFFLQGVALRLMSPAAVGAFVLWYGVASVSATAAGVGVPQLLARSASLREPVAQCRRSLWAIPSVLATVVGLVVVCAAQFSPQLARLGVPGAIILLALIVTQNLQGVESSLQRSSGHFAFGAFIQQGVPLLTAAMLLLPLALHWQTRVVEVLSLLLVSQVSLVLASGGLVVWRGAPGDSARPVWDWLRSNRLLLAGFWISSSVGIAYRWADRFVVAGVLSVESLATYQSLFLLTSLFDLLSVGLGYVQLPRHARSGEWSRANLRVAGGMIGIATSTTLPVAWLLGARVFFIHWSSETLLAFALLLGVGALKLVYAELSAALGALSSGSGMMRFSLAAGLSLLLGVACSAALGHVGGMWGVTLGSLAAWVLRVYVAYRLVPRA